MASCLRKKYSGYGYGFCFGGGEDRWGKGADEAVVETVVRQVRAFLERSMPFGWVRGKALW